MSGFLEKYNTDDVFLRSLITALLRSLNDKLTYTQINDQQQILEVFIPFFYSMTGDESFLQDFFIEYKNCDTDELIAEGNYDVVPRGVLTFSGGQIETGSLTNKFTRMSYTVEDLRGEMKTYSSFTNSVPLSFNFNCVIKSDTVLDSFKVFQSTIATFYKTFQGSFEYSGLRIPFQVGFPENYEINKQFDFTYSTNPQLIDFTFQIAVETYFPEKDMSTERFRGNLMQAGIRADQVISPNSIISQNKEVL
jgi:hypothetical protein